MAKVDFPQDASSYLNPGTYANFKSDAKKTRDRGALRGVRGSRFAETLEQAGEAAEAVFGAAGPVSEEELRGLLDAVHSSGDDLKQRPFPEEILRYKQAVRNFINQVVRQAYNLKEETYLLNRKKYIKIQIQVVDSKLDQLAAAILSGQLSQLELLARVDEINGILVNLME
ncbi:MAG: YaaR family protein [Treponema sp.]|jgi:uncharacterized protein YaaR (DUF327 family)|nr:YaaR family protein [Treponema sp.]